MSPPKLILASSSAYRQELLKRLGLPFLAVAPAIDESARPRETPAALVRRLALAKACAVARGRHDALVIGGDQVAAHHGTIIGKPRNRTDAVRQLRAASGRRITLYTGLAMVNTDSGRARSAVVPCRILFRTLSDGQIKRYLDRERPYDCTGSVRVEGFGIALLRGMEGNDPTAVIGLPLIHLVRMLEREGVSVL
jgi:septum formation protein